jgi:hypothetical protein
LGMAILMPIIRLWFDALWGLPGWSLFELVNGATQIFVLAVLAILAYRQGREIETLRDLLRVCSFCHRVRIHENHWESLERYVVQHSRTRFSHGVCRDCAEMYDERGGSMMVAQASAEPRATPQRGSGH